MRLPAEIITERDAKIFELKKAGMNFRQIANALGIATSTAYEGYMRESRRTAKMSSEAAFNEIWLQADQLDQLIFNLWPLTRPHKIRTDDGEEIEVPANMDAIDRVSRLLAQKARLLGIEKQVLQIETNNSSTPDLGENAAVEKSPEQMAKELGVAMIQYGVIGGSLKELLESALVGDEAKKNDENVIDAEVIEDSDDYTQQKELNIAPPEWVDDEDLDNAGPAWLKDLNMEDNSD